MKSTSRALFLLFFHCTLTDGASIIRKVSKKRHAAVVQKTEVSSRGSVVSRLQEEASPRIENATPTLLEDYALSLSDTGQSDKSGGDSVQCKFTIDNYVDSASYGGHNLHIHGDKNKWEVDKVVNFHLKSGAYLVVCGRNIEGNSCASGGFAISCNRHVPGNRGAWQAIADNNRRSGEGGGWHTPCGSSSGFFLPANRGAEKMFASSANPACFRWRTPDIDCVMHHFGAWGACSKTCGTGKQARTRGVKQNARMGGTACPAAREEKDCNTKPCPVDCVVNEWNDWGDCSETCGGGEMQRNRTVETAVQHGGQACPNLTNSTECNTQDCPKDGARGGVVLSEIALIYLIALSCFHLSA